MREYLTDAVVLDREGAGETDARIFLYTKELGRVTARAKSASAITSRLSSYLQPLRYVQARLVEKNGFQVVDVLPVSAARPHKNAVAHQSEIIELYQIVRQLTAEHHPDEKLWQELHSSKPSGLKILTILGFDPRHAQCTMCEAKTPEYFSSTDAHYYCAKCVKTFSATNGLYRLERTKPRGI